ncbi:adenylate cyclase class 2 [Nocardia transvalensis]|uniref:Adenylate cyclase class 2 n=1 Tax=Nocardia transvalensis TaxID=37333 RepID=A0A7W9PCI8_9NOCA|nr:CYTH domain-containing protein [Nocardia transvalensis]MBB5913599.1 adenylate cyclase class 2 [Nocardia transvalensis]
MIEAEYKARLADPDRVRGLLNGKANPDRVSYQDTYFDREDGSLTSRDQELRLRTVSGNKGSEHLLTFKDATVDQETGSKPEFETLVGERESAEEIIKHLGFRPDISFTKNCENYRYAAAGRDVLATVVTVPEIDGVFLEIETLVPDGELDSALADLRGELAELGISPDQWTTELYTDAVRKSRNQ